eukprot:TRINITY_DN1589_c0_g1_i1.p1 TRINITY_DN1589_c0_g1~~TRINITY_DN1589_c0_g1_i1.p1  ORF type:complete len:479 (-),score=59.08 TRINITY_DN1589_c0_g1_i1:170-1606(-)
MDVNCQMNCVDSQESLESPSPSPSPTHMALHRINTVSMIHEEKCFCCGSSSKPESRLIKCSFCPMSYHYECLPAGTVITTPRWGCPSHKCAVCAAPSSKSKGRMFRCILCPTAFCLAHVSPTCQKIEENPYENSGYNCSTFKFIVCDHCECRSDEYFQKRKLSLLAGSNANDDSETRPLKRSRTDSYSSVGSAEERAMSYASSPSGSPVIGRARQKPDEELVQIFKEVIGSKFRLQKQLADEIGISQPILSQFLNSATRNNGWRLLEEKLRSWWSLMKQDFEPYKEQRKLARLSNDTAKGQIKAERRNRSIRASYHGDNNRGSIDSQSSNEFNEVSHGSGDSYHSGESDYSPRNSLTSKEEAYQPVKMQYTGYTAEPANGPQYAYMYSYPTHVPETFSYPQLQKNFVTSVPLNQHAEAQQTHQASLPTYAVHYDHHNTNTAVSNNAQNTAQPQPQQQPYIMLDYNNYWATDVFPQHYH